MFPLFVLLETINFFIVISSRESNGHKSIEEIVSVHVIILFFQTPPRPLTQPLLFFQVDLKIRILAKGEIKNDPICLAEFNCCNQLTGINFMFFSSLCQNPAHVLCGKHSVAVPY